MKKLVASIGLVTVGAATAHAQYAPGLTPLETSKAWSVSADLRGFYDDNFLTLPKQVRQSTWGAEVSPSVAVNHSIQDTLFTASYVYDARWYATHPTADTSLDQSHNFNARMDHQFSDRYKLSLNESFVIAQEPTVIDPTVISTPLRLEGNNIRNSANADFTASLTRLLDLHLGYGNTLYAYQQKFEETTVPAAFIPSRSAALDRMEQTATVDLRWKATPDTTGVFGYQYEHVDYTSPEFIILPSLAMPAGYSANSRNNDQHFIFVGADQSFMPDLNGSIRVGGEIIDYYNVSPSLTKASPYADANLTWQYTPQSTAQLGVKVVRDTTDVVGYTTPTLDTQTSVLYGSVNHNITDHFSITAMGQSQWSIFNGGDGAGVGSIDGKLEDFYVFGVNIAYHFNPWFLTEAGYDYSKLNSEIAYRSYTRNQVYLGFRGTY